MFDFWIVTSWSPSNRGISTLPQSTPAPAAFRPRARLSYPPPETSSPTWAPSSPQSAPVRSPPSPRPSQTPPRTNPHSSHPTEHTDSRHPSHRTSLARPRFLRASPPTVDPADPFPPPATRNATSLRRPSPHESDSPASHDARPRRTPLKSASKAPPEAPRPMPDTHSSNDPDTTDRTPADSPTHAPARTTNSNRSPPRSSTPRKPAFFYPPE